MEPYIVRKSLLTNYAYDKLVFHAIHTNDQRIVHDIDVCQELRIVEASPTEQSLRVLPDIERVQMRSYVRSVKQLGAHSVNETYFRLGSHLVRLRFHAQSIERGDFSSNLSSQRSKIAVS